MCPRVPAQTPPGAGSGRCDVVTGLTLVLAAGLAVVGYVLSRHHLRARRQAASLDDDAIRRIETQGRVDVEEPLDLQEAHEEEERFWEEDWDEPDPW